MQVAALIIAAVLCAVSPAFAADPDPLANGSFTAPGETGLRDSESLAEPQQTFRKGDALPAEYYTQQVEAVEGVVTAVDPENSTISIMGKESESRYFYDGLTRFQVKLKPICPTDLKVGAKIAGLYREKDGALYISRVVVITGEPQTSVKKSSKHKKKKSSRYKKKRRRR